MAWEAFGPGHENVTLEQDNHSILCNAHMLLAECLVMAGAKSVEALKHAWRARELCPVNEGGKGYMRGFRKTMLVTGILCELGRVSEAEALLRTTLQKQLNQAGPPPHPSKASQSIARLRGELARLLARYGERHEEALTELTLMREAFAAVTDPDELEEWKEFLPKYYFLAADCLWLLGLEVEACT
jgi:hypothetical protein